MTVEEIGTFLDVEDVNLFLTNGNVFILFNLTVKFLK